MAATQSDYDGTNRYRAHEWERRTAVITGICILVFVGYLIYRNEPFRDPNLVVLARTILALAIAICGATIPGFFQLEWNVKGFLIRAGGALGLFAAVLLFTPKVLPALDTSKTELNFARLQSISEQFNEMFKALSSKLERLNDKQAVEALEKQALKYRAAWALAKKSFTNGSLSEQGEALDNMQQIVADMERAMTNTIPPEIPAKPTNEAVARLDLAETNIPVLSNNPVNAPTNFAQPKLAVSPDPSKPAVTNPVTPPSTNGLNPTPPPSTNHFKLLPPVLNPPTLQSVD